MIGIKKTLRHSLALLPAMALLGCASTDQAASTHNLNASSSWGFSTKDGERIPGEPAACGPEISADEVVILDVAKEDDPRVTVLARFPKAQFATEDYVLLAVKTTPAQTQEGFSHYLASKGCDVVIFGDTETAVTGESRMTDDGIYRTRTLTLRVIWGTREIAP